MKKVILAIAALASAHALADGFICSTESGLDVKVYNHTRAALGTRTAAIMVLSDSSQDEGSKTIATFADTQSLLQSSTEIYTAKVDLRYKTNSNKNAEIAGTVLSNVDSVQLAVDYNYSFPLANGQKVNAELSVYKRDGGETSEHATCERYLKN